MAFRAVIFDFDGVLVDTEPLHFRALRESLRSEGIVIDQEQYFVVLGYDDRAGIASARAAGMTVMGVAHSYALEKLGAHRVVGSLEALQGEALLGG